MKTELKTMDFLIDIRLDILKIKFWALTIILCFILLETMILAENDMVEVRTIETSNLTASLREINTNCGSMFITTKWGSNNLYVFNAGGYTPLEDCLK
jgi:hypothetical protein